MGQGGLVSHRPPGCKARARHALGLPCRPHRLGGSAAKEALGSKPILSAQPPLYLQLLEGVRGRRGLTLVSALHARPACHWQGHQPKEVGATCAATAPAPPLFWPVLHASATADLHSCWDERPAALTKGRVALRSATPNDSAKALRPPVSCWRPARIIAWRRLCMNWLPP